MSDITSLTPQNGIPVLFSKQAYYAKTIHPPAFA
jgi:hypothetical protein